MTAEAKVRKRLAAGAVMIDQHWIDEALKTPPNFGYHGGRPIGESWSLGPVVLTRDAKLIDRSNYDALIEALEGVQKDGIIEDDSWEITRAGHFAVGWVEHLSFRVVDDAGQPTNVAKFVKAWFEALDEYALANEDAYSQLEYDTAIENITNTGKNFVSDKAPEDWPGQVFTWLWDNNQSELENVHDQGASPSRGAVREALIYTGLIDPDEIEEEELEQLPYDVAKPILRAKRQAGETS